MSRIRMKTIREMSEKDLLEHIQERRSEMTKLRIDAFKGTMRKERGSIKPMRRDIARMLTRLAELKKK